MTKDYSTEIISVGTELLLGHVTNTDARDISELLSQIGINVLYHTVVGDNPQRVKECVEQAKSRADIIITTGGLGPTCDDLTKQLLAESFGLELVADETEMQGLYDYIQRGRLLTANNFSQAMLPQGCTVFHNNWGTAPGCAFQKDGKTVIMMPGPPNECVPMFKHWAMPYLQKLSGQHIVSHTVDIFGMGESTVDDLFASRMDSMHNPSMAPYAKECDCLLKITAKAESVEKAEAMIQPVLEDVKAQLGDVVYGVDLDCVEQGLLPLLLEKGLSFSAAESCTGGYIAKRITDLPGSSAVFKGGLVTYTNEAKSALLGIDPELIKTYGAVSKPVARAMAENCRRILGTDLAVSVTGLAGPEGDGVNPVGTVFVALAVPGECFVRALDMGSYHTRSYVRRMSGNHAFDMMRRYINGLPMAWPPSFPNRELLDNTK